MRASTTERIVEQAARDAVGAWAAASGSQRRRIQARERGVAVERLAGLERGLERPIAELPS